MKKIAIASGKGGTGKTTFALLLSRALLEKFRVHLVDCDVEEPNCHLFLNFKKELSQKQEVTVFTPEINYERCDYCRKCVDVCRFKALILIDKTFVKFDELCIPCKACMLACPRDAIREGKRVVGEKFFSEIEKNFYLSFAYMQVSEARSTPIISELKKNLGKEADFAIFDSPPGASCPVVEVIKDVDKVFLVTEPTPFGLYDLKIIWNVVKVLKKDASIVINKSGSNDFVIENFAKENGIDVALKIPFSREFAEKYSKAQIDLNYFPAMKERILDLIEK